MKQKQRFTSGWEVAENVPLYSPSSLFVQEKVSGGDLWGRTGETSWTLSADILLIFQYALKKYINHFIFAVIFVK